jgi:hypothetical protein
MNQSLLQKISLTIQLRREPVLNLNRIACILFLVLGSAQPLPASDNSAVDGVTVKGGVVYTVQGGRLEILQDNLKLPFDVEVNANGTFKVAKGKERRLTEGQEILREGWLLNPDGSIQPVIDHVAMKAGKVMVVRDGQPEALGNPMTFPNNMTVAPDGMCTDSSGRRFRLVDGQLFQLDGAPLPAKDAVTLKNGRVVVQKDGTMIRLTPVQVMGMNDGTRVRGTGVIEKQNGTTIQLAEGQTILIEGLYIKR